MSPLKSMAASSPIIKSQWVCCQCDERHTSRYKAQDCCPNEVDETWFCPMCDEAHHNEALAIACCDLDPDAPPSMAPPLERERAGQLRLVP